jgi:hypothetical protein
MIGRRAVKDSDGEDSAGNYDTDCEHNLGGITPTIKQYTFSRRGLRSYLFDTP